MDDITLNGQQIDLFNPDDFGRAIRAVNRHWLHEELHHCAPKTGAHVAGSMIGVLSRWADDATTNEDRRRMARWVLIYDLS